MLQQPTQLAHAELPATGVRAWLRAPAAALRRAYTTNRALTLLGLLMLITLVASLIGLAFDQRMITGVPAWLKPLKFSVSIGLYSFTLLWVLSFIQGRRFWVGLVSSVTLLAFLVEIVMVITQVLRGTSSHFNVSDAFNALLFSAMGLFVLVIWVMNLVAAILLLFQRLADPALAWALRLGLLLTLLGAGLGALMTIPTADQRALMATGVQPMLAGAHSVGVADGGAGMPLTGWSTTGGDLRIGHFIGLHALQVLPLLGLLLAHPRMRALGQRRRIFVIWLAALSYLGLIALVTWQALRGQPLLAPDAATLVVAGAWLGATVLGLGAALGLGRAQEAR